MSTRSLLHVKLIIPRGFATIELFRVWTLFFEKMGIIVSHAYGHVCKTPGCERAE